MARTNKLKVFRTAIGFYDAYIAAPSQKAALQAWGSDADLFARGIAERVDDPTLMQEPLAHPGEVIRRSRGSVSEHIAALSEKRAGRENDASHPIDAKTSTSPRAPRKPKPKREKLQKSEQALGDADAMWDAKEAELNEQFALLQRERRTLVKEREAKRPELERAIERERAHYNEAIRKWND